MTNSFSIGRRQSEEGHRLPVFFHTSASLSFQKWLSYQPTTPPLFQGRIGIVRIHILCKFTHNKLSKKELSDSTATLSAVCLAADTQDDRQRHNGL